MGLEYFTATRYWDGITPTEVHVIDFSFGDHEDRYLEDWKPEMKMSQVGEKYVGWSKEPVPELRAWLDVNTPGWRLDCYKVIREFVFETREHAMLFKLTWA